MELKLGFLPEFEPGTFIFLPFEPGNCSNCLPLLFRNSIIISDLPLCPPLDMWLPGRRLTLLGRLRPGGPLNLWLPGLRLLGNLENGGNDGLPLGLPCYNDEYIYKQ